METRFLWERNTIRSEPTWEKRTITRLNLDNSNNGKDLAMEDITKRDVKNESFSSWNVLDFKNWN